MSDGSLGKFKLGSCEPLVTSLSLWIDQYILSQGTVGSETGKIKKHYLGLWLGPWDLNLSELLYGGWAPHFQKQLYIEAMLHGAICLIQVGPRQPKSCFWFAWSYKTWPPITVSNSCHHSSFQSSNTSQATDFTSIKKTGGVFLLYPRLLPFTSLPVSIRMLLEQLGEL